MFEDVKFPVYKKKERLQCQTLTKQGKRPCRAPGILTKKGTIRCRIHGGWSTGPRTTQGRLRALQNLKNHDKIIKSYGEKRPYFRKIAERKTTNSDL